MEPCNGRHTKGDGSWWDSDARGIATARVCARCIEQKRQRYRPEIFSDAHYESDEPVEAQG
jgi:hypothetical protein